MPERIKLKESDLACYHALERREQGLKDKLQADLREIALEAGQMMEKLSKRRGVNLYEFDIDWTTGECTRKPLPQLPQGESDAIH